MCSKELDNDYGQLVNIIVEFCNLKTIGWYIEEICISATDIVPRGTPIFAGLWRTFTDKTKQNGVLTIRGVTIVRILEIVKLPLIKCVQLITLYRYQNLLQTIIWHIAHDVYQVCFISSLCDNSTEIIKKKQNLSEIIMVSQY